MKKILLTTVALAALSSTSLAADSPSMDNNFYFLVEGGASFYNNVKVTTEFKRGKTVNGDSLKPKNVSGIFGAGVGGYVIDNVRADVVYNYFLDQDLKLKNDKDYKEILLTAKAMSLLVNAYVDVVDVSAFKVFLGAGVGIANIQDVYVKHTYDDKDVNGERTTNFAYAIHGGVSFGLNDGVDLVIKYSFRDNGKTKMKTIKQDIPLNGPVEYKLGHTKYRTNNVTLGIRFNI